MRRMPLPMSKSLVMQPEVIPQKIVLKSTTLGKETLLTCHSSSSTASPPSRSSVPAPNNSGQSDFHVEEPYYFPQQLNGNLLEGSGLDKTVFGTFSASNELIEVVKLFKIFKNILEI